MSPFIEYLDNASGYQNSKLSHNCLYFSTTGTVPYDYLITCFVPYTDTNVLFPA